MRRGGPARPDALVARAPENPVPEFGSITLQEAGEEIRVLEAAPRSRISLALLTSPGSPRWIRIWDDKIGIAEQVVYQVTGWDALHAALEVVLVKDHRPPEDRN